MPWAVARCAMASAYYAMALVGGCPAKVIKYRDAEEYKRLKEQGLIYLTLKKQGKTRLKDEERCEKVER